MAVMVNGATKKGQALLAKARHNEGTELYHVYRSVSAAKMRAMEQCKAWCKEDGGRNFHIISHNSHRFSVAWEYDHPETGEIMTRIETAEYTYIVDGSRADYRKEA